MERRRRGVREKRRGISYAVMVNTTGAQIWLSFVISCLFVVAEYKGVSLCYTFLKVIIAMVLRKASMELHVAPLITFYS